MIDYKALAGRIQQAIDAQPLTVPEVAMIDKADLRTVVSLLEGMAEEKPVAWMRPDNRVREESTIGKQFNRGAQCPPIGTWVPLYLHPAPQPIPEGWQLVPKEPTREMLAEIKFMDVITDQAMTDRYRAMLVAAPHPAPQPQSQPQPEPTPKGKPGFVQQIENSRENVRAWPQWMQDATVESAATMPKWPAPQPQPERQPESEPTRWKVGNELAPYHPDASHVEPGYRDGWNACYRAMRESEPTEAQIECHGLDTPERVCFYEQDFYVLSNFSSFSVQWRGHRYPTSEHVYHVEKFRNYRGDIADMIAFAPSAHEAFKIAERHKADRRPDWDEIKVEVMREILRAKAMQHEYVRRKLLATGDRELVENSWRDDFWGWGPNRNGQNMLGKLWMEVRAELRAALAARESK